MSLRLRLISVLALVAVLAAAWLWHLDFNDGMDLSDTAAVPTDDPTLLARGAYLARVGNCISCHTARGGAPAAGGRAIVTEFGTVFSSNLTPDPETGIGRWSAAAFRRALHHGRSIDGRLLVPAFPYTHTTMLVRADVEALHAWLRSLPPVRAARPAHELRWPFGTQVALAAWRAFYFRPGEYRADPQQSAEWNRGAYLVQGVAHCSACHARRDVLGGADWSDMRGGMLKAQGWYAPSLLDAREAGVADWPAEDIVRLLRAGVTERGRASGLMAEVVLGGTQFLSDADSLAMASYLKSLPQVVEPALPARQQAEPSRLAQAGARLYGQHCAQCHGERGQGQGGLAYPALAGNRAVMLGPVDNLLQAVLHGGFNAATPGYPRPFGMPPFMLELDDAQIAAVLSHIRTAWGNQAGEVTPLQVHTLRSRIAPVAAQ